MHRLVPGSEQRLMHYRVRIDDGESYYSLVDDVFFHRIYHFDARRPDPLILDCGSHIGGAILYFKHVYPKARIVGFEPDPAIFPVLEGNIRRNNLSDVHLVHAALAARAETVPFYSDGKSGSCLATHAPDEPREGRQRFEVSCVRLADYLTGPVDFLKMNIESAEWEVLSDAGDRLQLVREMVIECHHLPGLPRTLHKILALLDSLGFEYIINDFDSGLNGGVTTPFQLSPWTRYFLLVYAKRFG